MSSDKDNLASVSKQIGSLLKERDPRQVDGITNDLHSLPPFVERPRWNELAAHIQDAEQLTCDSIPGNFYISLRLDGSGFGKLLKRLRHKGVLPPRGFSSVFADAMVSTCRAVLTKFSAQCGYTQSDELTVLVYPTSVIRGVQQPHSYNGRVQKLCSQATSCATVHWNHFMMQHAQQQGVMDFTLDLMATFDCRVGKYQTKQEAYSVLLWRAYDCGVNGVSDAVHHCRGVEEGAKKMADEPTEAKLKWLLQHGQLPLDRHQREGTFLAKRKRTIAAVNPITGEATECIRSRIEDIPGNVLQLYKEGKLYSDDEPPE